MATSGRFDWSMQCAPPANSLFGMDLTKEDLPCSKKTCQRIPDEGHYSSNQHTKPNIWNPTIRDFDDFWNICSFMGKNDKSEKIWRSDHRFGFYGVMVVWYKGRNRAISAPSYII